MALSFIKSQKIVLQDSESFTNFPSVLKTLKIFFQAPKALVVDNSGLKKLNEPFQRYREALQKHHSV